MTARAIYKATLCLKEWQLPVKLYSAVNDKTVHFRLLHAKDGVPLKQRMVDPDTGHTVAKDEYRRAYVTEKGQMVILTEQDQAHLEPNSSRKIEVLRFVSTQALNHQWYVRPYILGPDGSSEPYFSLAHALHKAEQEAIVHWVMRKKQYRGALRAEGGYLVLMTLRHLDEVLDARELPAPSGRKLDNRELQMAEQLVSLLSGSFQPDAFQDDHRQRLLALIEKKARGESVKLASRAPARESRGSLSKMLSASLKAARSQRVA